jgi:predicted site-specific integrase-resolvase
VSSKFRNTANGEPLIDTDALAQHLSVSPRTIRAWVLQKKIPCYHISAKCLRFRLSEIMNHLEKRKGKPVSL